MSDPFLIRVCQALSAHKVRYGIVGGHAVALHGAVRGTVDVDIALNWNRKSLAAAETALTGLGLRSRLPLTADDVFQFRDEYVRNRNLIAWNFYNPGDLTEQLDVLVDYDIKGRSLKTIRIADVPIRILNKKDLIAMKRASGRPQDLEDCKALEAIK